MICLETMELSSSICELGCTNLAQCSLELNEVPPTLPASSTSRTPSAASSNPFEQHLHQPEVCIAETLPTRELQLRPIGARKKGRRKGCKNRPLLQRRQQAEAKKKVKNEKERKRVENIQHEYSMLRQLLGDENEKLSKLQVLNSAINYIRTLLEQTQKNSGFAECETFRLSHPQQHEFADSSQCDFSLSPYSRTSSSSEELSPCFEGCSGQVFHCPNFTSQPNCYDMVSENSLSVLPAQSMDLSVTAMPVAPSMPDWMITSSHPPPPPLRHFSYQ